MELLLSGCSGLSRSSGWVPTPLHLWAPARLRLAPLLLSSSMRATAYSTLTPHTPPGALAQPVARQGRAAADLLDGPLQQVMVVGHEFKAPSLTHNVAKVPSPSKTPAPQPQSSRIAIPAYRRLQPSREPGMSVSTQG